VHSAGGASPIVASSGESELAPLHSTASLFDVGDTPRLPPTCHLRSRARSTRPRDTPRAPPRRLPSLGSCSRREAGHQESDHVAQFAQDRARAPRSASTCGSPWTPRLSDRTRPFILSAAPSSMEPRSNLVSARPTRCRPHPTSMRFATPRRATDKGRRDPLRARASSVTAASILIAFTERTARARAGPHRPPVPQPRRIAASTKRQCTTRMPNAPEARVDARRTFTPESDFLYTGKHACAGTTATPCSGWAPRLVSPRSRTRAPRCPRGDTRVRDTLPLHRRSNRRLE
jgi:hypothetical protein